MNLDEHSSRGDRFADLGTIAVRTAKGLQRLTFVIGAARTEETIAADPKRRSLTSRKAGP